MYTPLTRRPEGIAGERPAPERGKEHLARIDLLKEKVEAALRVLNEHPDGPDTLGLFLAPEWFFTGKEGDKPYTLAQVHEVIAKLEAFSKAHPDLVLVPGSIRWARPEPEPPPWTREKGRKSGGSAPPSPEPTQALFNSAVVVQGGKMKFMYHKQHEGSDVGGAPVGTKQVFVNEVEGTWAFAQWASRDPRVLVPKEGAEPSTAGRSGLRRTGAPSNFFTIEGIDFAVDICADFGRGTALRAYLDSQKGEGVDVHLVMAAGFGGDLSPSTTVARVGGLHPARRGRLPAAVPREAREGREGEEARGDARGGGQEAQQELGDGRVRGANTEALRRRAEGPSDLRGRSRAATSAAQVAGSARDGLSARAGSAEVRSESPV
jgi:predicted amidohydrolase